MSDYAIVEKYVIDKKFIIKTTLDNVVWLILASWENSNEEEIWILEDFLHDIVANSIYDYDYYC